MKNVKLDTKKFRKGDLVKAAPVDDLPVMGFYQMTADEIEAENRKLEEKIEYLRAIGADESEEDRLVEMWAWQSVCTYQELNTNMVYEIRSTRGLGGYPWEYARLSSVISWMVSTISGNGPVKILDTESGRELYCDRDDLLKVG